MADIKKVIDGDTEVTGTLTLGETLTMGGAFYPRQIANLNVAGTQGEIVVNTGDWEAYLCTVTGTQGTFKALT